MELYNSEIKQWYMNTVSPHVGSVNNIRNYFLKAVPLETKLGKDLCDWNLREILLFMKMFGTSSRTVIMNCISVYKGYTDFCTTNNIVKDCINHYMEITNKMIDDSVNMAKLTRDIIKREDLLAALSKIPSYSDRFVILCCYEGIDGYQHNEILNAHTNNIIGNKMKVSENRIVDISSELQNYAFWAAEEECRAGLADKEYNMPLNMEDPTLIVKPRATKDKIPPSSIQSRMKRWLIAIDLENISTKKLMYSGAVRYIDMECKKYNVDAETFLMSPELNKNFCNQYQYYQTASRMEYLSRYRAYLQM